MTNLIRAPHQLDDENLTCRAVVETPKGRRSKYDYDPELGAFELSGLLPEGMSFPLDFGFVTGTRAEDGDPLDVLVLADEPSAVGAVVKVRLIGVIEAEQSEDGRMVRNDRLIAVATVSRLYAQVRRVEDLGDDYVDHLVQFWVQFNALKPKSFKVLRVGDAQAAAEAVRRSALA